MLQSLASWRAALSRDDYLVVRLKRLLVWAGKCNVADLQLGGVPNQEADCALALPQVCTSRFLCAPEFRTLVVACRGFCRLLARPDLLEPLMKISELGYCQIQGFSETAAKRLAWLDESILNARAGMRSLGVSSVTALRAEIRLGEPAGDVTIAHALLEPTASLVGDNHDQGDSFAARCLLSEGPAFLARAQALRPETVPLLRRKRFRRAFAKHQEAIRAAAAGSARDSKGQEPEVFQKLASWLVIVDAWFENLPLLAGLSAMRESLVAHIVPLTAWLVRPHKRPLLGRAMPPPDPPDAVLRDQEKLLRGFVRQGEVEAQPKKVVHQAPLQRESKPKVTEAVPFLVGRWLKENSTLDVEEGKAYTAVETDRSSEVRIDDLFGGDSGTLVYSTDEEDVDSP